MKCSWREGNKIQLLENGEQYYPAVFKAIGEAQERIILETFIWFEDDVGKQLHAALLAAAQRGVKAEVLLDGYGSPDLSDEFVNELTAAGVVFRYYDPRPRLFGMRTNVFRRMHRKIVVIDARIAFIGGRNISVFTLFGGDCRCKFSSCICHYHRVQHCGRDVFNQYAGR